MAMMATMLVWGAGEAAGRMREVPAGIPVRIYLDVGAVYLGGLELSLARQEASRIFEEAGIRLEWSTDKPKDGESGPQVVGVRFVSVTPAAYRDRQHAQALAAALPYSTGPASITVFGDRVLPLMSIYTRRAAGQVLGHILAHEIGHMLEAEARHSPTGLMKARWSEEDLRAMTASGLSLAEEDREPLRMRFLSSAAPAAPVAASAEVARLGEEAVR